MRKAWVQIKKTNGEGIYCAWCLALFLSTAECSLAQQSPAATNSVSVEELCPCGSRWENHGAYVACVESATASLEQRGLIDAAQRADVVKQAAESDCGKKLTTADEHSGIRGQTLNSRCPMPDIGPGCTYPVVASLNVFSEDGSFVTEVVTGSQGLFQVDLRPGGYIVIPLKQPYPTPYRPGAPFPVDVPFKQFTNVVVLYLHDLPP